MAFKDRLKDAARKSAEIAKEKYEERQQRQEDERQAAATATPPAPDYVMKTTSREEGRNAEVTVYRDRIERVKPRSFNSWGKSPQDVEVIPIKNVSSVQLKKGRFGTDVTIFATGNTIEMRVPNDDAQRLQREVMRLVTEPSQSSTTATSTVDIADQLSKLAALRDQGVLSEEEFAAQKALLLSSQ